MTAKMTKEEFYKMIDNIAKTSDMKDAFIKRKIGAWEFYNAAYENYLEISTVQAGLIAEHGNRRDISVLQEYQKQYVNDIMKFFLFIDDQLYLIRKLFSTKVITLEGGIHTTRTIKAQQRENESLQKQIEDNESENKSLAAEIDELKAQSDQNIFSELPFAAHTRTNKYCLE